MFRGVIFDMDGTLTVPTIDFEEIRREIGLPPGGDLAARILALPETPRERAWAIIERHEAQAIRDQRLQDGCAELLDRCRRAQMRLGVVTRNTAVSVTALCARFGLSFDTIVARDFKHIKPHPGPVLHILEQWGLAPAQTLFVGDYVHDVMCGQSAGTATCFFRNPGKQCEGATPDWTVSSMGELERLLFGGEKRV